MSSNNDGVEVLSEDQCWEYLTDTSVGRLAIDIAGKPDIFPINFVCDGNTIVFRTGAGTKLAGAALLHHVAFEVDGYLPNERVAWSVVIKGWAEQIEQMLDVYAADDLPLFPWIANPKPNYVRVTPREVSGRRFHILDDVRPDTSIGWEPVKADPLAAPPAPGAEYHPGSPQLHAD